MKKLILSAVAGMMAFILIIVMLNYVTVPEKVQLHLPRENEFGYQDTTPPPDDSLCASNSKKYSTVAEALAEMNTACFLKITSAQDLQKIPSASTSLQSIEKLVIMDIEDAVVPPAIGILQGVKELTIDALEGDSFVSPHIGDLKNLIILKVAETELERLPPEIGELKNMRTLYVSRNEGMTSLPASVAKLTRLENITIRYNPELSIPSSLFSHKSIRSIKVAGQNSKSIPENIFSLPLLTKLDYSDNQLSTMSARLNKLTSVEYLNLGVNQLQYIPSVKNLSNLTELHLNANYLRSLPHHIENLKQLKRLNIAGNFLKNSEAHQIQHLTSLTHLDLGYNQLTKVPPGIENLKKLEYLRLEGNYIDLVEIEALRNALPEVVIMY